MDQTPNFKFKWNDHISHLSQIFSELRCEEQYCDTTLVSEDGFVIRAHAAVLVAASGYFARSLANITSFQHPIIVLSGANFSELSCILDYIYEGVTQVEQPLMECVLEVADMLEVKGLCRMRGNASFKRLMAPSPPPSRASPPPTSVSHDPRTFKTDTEFAASTLPPPQMLGIDLSVSSRPPPPPFAMNEDVSALSLSPPTEDANKRKRKTFKHEDSSDTQKEFDSTYSVEKSVQEAPPRKVKKVISKTDSISRGNIQKAECLKAQNTDKSECASHSSVEMNLSANAPSDTAMPETPNLTDLVHLTVLRGPNADEATCSSAPKPRVARITKSKTEVKRPMTKYTLFLKETYPTLRNQHPDLKGFEIVKKVSTMWRGMPLDEKSEWESRASELLAVFQRDHPDYVFRPNEIHHRKQQYRRQAQVKKNLFRVVIKEIAKKGSET